MLLALCLQSTYSDLSKGLSIWQHSSTIALLAAAPDLPAQFLDGEFAA